MTVTATSRRMTRGGRPLVDRKRRVRVERNMDQVIETLQEMGVAPGPEGVGQVRGRGHRPGLAFALLCVCVFCSLVPRHCAYLCPVLLGFRR